MTELEFRVLDELYFVIHYDELLEACNISEYALLDTLTKLYRKKWIRVMSSPEQEIDPGEINLEKNYTDYFYLASKSGLFAHNSTE